MRMLITIILFSCFVSSVAIAETPQEWRSKSIEQVQKGYTVGYRQEPVYQYYVKFTTKEGVRCIQRMRGQYDEVGGLSCDWSQMKGVWPK